MKTTTPKIEELLARTKIAFAPKPEFENEARRQMADDLNAIVCRVAWTLETGGDETDIAFAESALRVVERAALDNRITSWPAACRLTRNENL